MGRPRKELEEEEDAFEALMEEGEEGLPPLPPAPSQQREKARPASALVLAAGPPPQDALEAAKWSFRLHMLLAHEAILDEDLTPTQRRKEFRITTSGASKFLTDAARHDVATLIREDRAELERKRSNKASAKTEKLTPAPPGAKVIPIRNGPE